MRKRKRQMISVGTLVCGSILASAQGQNRQGNRVYVKDVTTLTLWTLN